jgi:hypothetical protein
VEFGNPHGVAQVEQLTGLLSIAVITARKNIGEGVWRVSSEQIWLKAEK